MNQPIDLAFEPLQPFLPQLKDTIENHRVAKIERVTWGQGEDTWHYALTFYPLMGGGGRGVVIRIDDITQRLSLEDMMVQSEKMLSVGGLAAGMAHEINIRWAPSCITCRTFGSTLCCKECGTGAAGRYRTGGYQSLPASP